MKKKMIMSICKLSPKSLNDNTKLIVVGYNSKSNSSYMEKMGLFYKEANKIVVFFNIKRLFFWLKKNVIISSKVSWIMGLLGQAEVFGFKK